MTGLILMSSCSPRQCFSSPSLILSSAVRFADTTTYPPPPRAQPQPHWKLPFGFFSRGADELDGHVVVSDGGAGGRPCCSTLILSLVLVTTAALLVGGGDGDLRPQTLD